MLSKEWAYPPPILERRIKAWPAGPRSSVEKLGEPERSRLVQPEQPEALGREPRSLVLAG